MTRTFALLVCLIAFAFPAQAENLLDWLESAHGPSLIKPEKASDHAILVTLEPGQQEMYPKVSPDGRYLLVTVSEHRRLYVSRRLTENGDPLNVVSEDIHAADSVSWLGKSEVSFLSSRAGGLGLWAKSASGQGVVRRLQSLYGNLTQAQVLPDGSVLAVRLEGKTSGQHGSVTHRDPFVNWDLSGFKSYVVRIDKNGLDHVLGEGTNPAVSPDGQWIVFSMAAGRSRHLFMMRVDGSELLQLTDDRSIDVQPAWSADGKWIVFTSNRGDVDIRHPHRGNWDIWAIGRDGRNLTRLTRDDARDGAPSVGRDGFVYFHSDRKVSSEERALHQVRGSVSGFH
ncbi:MAG: TolB protein, partial [Zetaproteobacteria bacterium]